MLPDRQIPFLILLMFLTAPLVTVGCTRSTSDSSSSGGDSSDQEPYAASGGVPGDPATQPTDSETAAAQAGSPGTPVPPTPNAPRTNLPTLSQQSLVPQLELKSDLSPDELSEFLGQVDQAVGLFLNGQSGITDRQQARTEFIRIANLKLEASRNLIQHPQSDQAARAEGIRGELQALSHLAWLGDVSAAEKLEKLAVTHLTSTDPQLAGDSRSSLIGFAVEALQNGAQDAPEKIVNLVEGWKNFPTTPDVPALLMMSDARAALARYGYKAEAKQVRDAILALYADVSDPNIAAMAAQAAGSVQFDEIDPLIDAALSGKEVTAEQWSAAVEQLIAASADLQTVRYLSGAALEFEALGKEELVAATYQCMLKHFDDPNTATGREVELGLTTRQARKQVIGRPFDPDGLPSLDGQPIKIPDYRGKV
ncbi:MAG: hypothetical protein MI861_27170, partial [Pirellulales bacterium]|nr:hypothetical protein [Pirellulales bacterium]